MDFEFTEDQLDLRDNIRSVLVGACPTSLVRAIYDDGVTGDGLWKQMVDLYWPALGIPEVDGGLGLGFLEVGILAEELGRAVAPGPLLATVGQFVPLVREAGSAAQRSRFLGGVADGSIVGTVALAEGPDWDPAAVRASARRADGGWVVSGVKRFVFDAAVADEIAVVARGEDGLGVFVVPAAAAQVTPTPLLDRTLQLADVGLDGVHVPEDRVLAAPGAPRATAAISRATDEATVVMALATVGTCRAIFEMTLQYAKDRIQYGRPIGSFQALKHRFADLFLEVERATSLAYFAAMTIAEDDDRRPVAVAMAKAAAGDCERLAAQEGLQLHGGIGYTWEHDLHFFLKRAKAGGALWGSAAHHRSRIAAMLGLTVDDERATA
ncbi:MAG: acyl-CoA dehydrogenase family protein [Acidimicrobiales bacterium]